MSTKIHFRPYNPKQILLFPECLDKDITENDPVFVVDSVIDEIRLDNFKKLYKETGRCPYHPKMMLKVIIYGYKNNLYSCRKIESALKRDVHFIRLAGYEQPDRNTINRFRNRVKEKINEVFTQLVLLLSVQYKRFRHFGIDKVKVDFAFFAIAFNLMKMCKITKNKGEKTGKLAE